MPFVFFWRSSFRSPVKRARVFFSAGAPSTRGLCFARDGVEGARRGEESAPAGLGVYEEVDTIAWAGRGCGRRRPQGAGGVDLMECSGTDPSGPVRALEKARANGRPVRDDALLLLPQHDALNRFGATTAFIA